MNKNAPLLLSKHESSQGETASVDIAISADGETIDLRSHIAVLPVNGSSGRDGRGPYRYDTNRVQAFLDALTTDIPVVISHDTEKGAVGWIKTGAKLVAMQDGTHELPVEYTPEGRALIENKRFKYYSPCFYIEPNEAGGGEVIGFHEVSLVLVPNLPLREAHAPEVVSVEQVARVEADLKAAHAAELLGIKDTHAAEVLALKDAHAQALAGLSAQIEKHAAEVQALKDTHAAQLVRHAVDDAIASGKFSPAQRPALEASATQDLERFQLFVAASPAISAHFHVSAPDVAIQDTATVEFIKSHGINPAYMPKP